MGLSGIFSIIGLICGFGVAIIGSVREKMPTVVFGIFLICFNVFTLYVNVKPETDEPTALDVYRGKTTLEITYKDSVAIDSVVVWK